MRNVPYSIKIGPVENAYSNNLGQFVVLRSAALPNVCVGCGGPAWGNMFYKEFEPLIKTSLPVIFLALYFIVGRRYLLAFPFCSTCSPENFRVRVIRINGDFAIFSGAAGKFIQSLPPISPDLSAQTSLNWLQRALKY